MAHEAREEGHGDEAAAAPVEAQPDLTETRDDEGVAMAADRPKPAHRPKHFPLPNEAFCVAPAFLEPPQEVVRGAGLQGDVDRTLLDLRIPLARPHPTRRPGSLRSRVFRTPDINPCAALHGLPRPV